ncbi:MAG: class I SAM-dependent methyltransferase [Oscillospiraceae bacterium]|jgi:ubiquinone/menaquinone biosynthesis C-methylase UbiE|nr:class I SAM-dependent methyltransferase [Oscillospiraceae bacterium]
MSSYSGAFARFYDRLTYNINYKKRAEYFKKLADIYGGGGRLLDLACGTGSLSVEFAALGYDVTAVDASEDMLSVAVSKSKGGIFFVRQRMERLSLIKSVDVAVCALDSLNHIIKAENARRVFERVSLFLNQGGVFIFDVNTLYKHTQILGNNIFLYDLPEVYCVWQNEYDAKNFTTTIDLDIFAPEKTGLYSRCSERFKERFYSGGEIKAFAEESGLDLVAVYEADSENAPAADAERLVYICRKR